MSALYTFYGNVFVSVIPKLDIIITVYTKPFKYSGDLSIQWHDKESASCYYYLSSGFGI